MRKILIALLIVIAFAALWLWRGRDLSILVDRFHLIQIITSAHSIKTIVYEGNGTSGVLHVDDLALSLNDTQVIGAPPNVGTTKDGQLALSFGGKVFPFGQALTQDDKLSANAPDGDSAAISIEHGALPWPNFFEINWMTGNSPKWKRNTYQRLVWKKPDGAKLEMLWRYEQYFYPRNGWTSALMTRPGATGLIRVEISNPPR